MGHERHRDAFPGRRGEEDPAELVLGRHAFFRQGRRLLSPADLDPVLPRHPVEGEPRAQRLQVDSMYPPDRPFDSIDDTRSVRKSRRLSLFMRTRAPGLWSFARHTFPRRRR